MSRFEVSNAVLRATQDEIDGAMWHTVNVLQSGCDLGSDFPTNSETIAGAVRQLRADLVELDLYRFAFGSLPKGMQP